MIFSKEFKQDLSFPCYQFFKIKSKKSQYLFKMNKSEQINSLQPRFQSNFNPLSANPPKGRNSSQSIEPFTFPQIRNIGLETSQVKVVDQNKISLKNNPIMESLFYKQYRLITSPNDLILLFSTLAFFFLLLTIFSYFQGLKVKQISVNYATQLKCIEQDKVSKKCLVNFQIKQEMTAPIYLIQYTTNNYVNHRKFIESYSPDQLKGKVISVDEAQKKCGNFVFNSEIFSNYSWGNTLLVPENIASPCGAKSLGYFNDTFSLFKNGQKIAIDESHIYNRTALNINRAPSSESTQWIDPQNQHYKQYLVDSSLMTKKKKWGVINNNLKAGQYQLIVNNNFMVLDMKLKKGILLSTATVMGGKQIFYPITFGICAFLSLAYALYVGCSFRHYSEIKLQQSRRSV